jgi:magnesium transporter
MQIIEFTPESLRFLDALPQAHASGFVWMALEREQLSAELPAVQDAAQKLGGSAILDVHCADLANPGHPSHYDFTSVYDLIAFRRLATLQEAQQEQAAKQGSSSIFDAISSRAVGFVVFDRLLISVHPSGCYAAKNFVQRFVKDAQQAVQHNLEASSRSRLPLSPTDLALRMLNVMVDSYLDLRKELTAQMDAWQAQLLHPSARFNDWNAIMRARGQLHLLEDLCDQQHDAMQEWTDCLLEFSQDGSVAQRDQLVARARDVSEHIERVAAHARRLEQSAETVVQIHFAAQGQRTNDIMRTLTALTAIFLPMNLIAGIFGMNFEFLPFIHTANGHWWALAGMLSIAMGLGLVFWRKRYLARTRS